MGMIPIRLIDELRVSPGKKAKLSRRETGWAFTDELKVMGKEQLKETARKLLEQNQAELGQAQDVLYAAGSNAVLVILQAMDAGGKDGTIKHVMSGVNPQGCQVTSFKVPSAEERAHVFLWRYTVRLPPRGVIGIFNRSYYEEVLVVRVHPEFLGSNRPASDRELGKVWQARYEDINAFERHLTRNGTTVLKFFLHISKGEQKRRLLERVSDPAKHWKFAASDLAERARWNDYMAAYEDALTATSTDWAPWYVIPADYKWVARSVVAEVVTRAIQALDLHYPVLPPEQEADLEVARRKLENE
jgi:PPK2 family polyphosphate:nucleotide phosphotransferase